MATPQTESCSPKIERLCWSRSCRDEAFIEWVILLKKPSKTSGQSSCAVIALISQCSQTQTRSAAYSASVEPSTYHKYPPDTAYISCSHSTQTEASTLYLKEPYYITDAQDVVSNKYIWACSMKVLLQFESLNLTAISLFLRVPLYLTQSSESGLVFICLIPSACGTCGDCVSFHPRNFKQSGSNVKTCHFHCQRSKALRFLSFFNLLPCLNVWNQKLFGLFHSFHWAFGVFGPAGKNTTAIFSIQLKLAKKPTFIIR